MTFSSRSRAWPAFVLLTVSLSFSAHAAPVARTIVVPGMQTAFLGVNTTGTTSDSAKLIGAPGVEEAPLPSTELPLSRVRSNVRPSPSMLVPIPAPPGRTRVSTGEPAVRAFADYVGADPIGQDPRGDPFGQDPRGDPLGQDPRGQDPYGTDNRGRSKDIGHRFQNLNPNMKNLQQTSTAVERRVQDCALHDLLYD